MQPGSLVEYIGGQCEKARKIYPLEKGIPYTVSSLGEHKFLDGVKPSLKLEEAGDRYGFWTGIFKEIQSPVTTEEILEVCKESVDLQII